MYRCIYMWGVEGCSGLKRFHSRTNLCGPLDSGQGLDPAAPIPSDLSNYHRTCVLGWPIAPNFIHQAKPPKSSWEH